MCWGAFHFRDVFFKDLYPLHLSMGATMSKAKPNTSENVITFQFDECLHTAEYAVTLSPVRGMFG